MLEDVLIITKEFIEESDFNEVSVKNLYNIFESLNKIISKIESISHYRLVVTFNEENLVNSPTFKLQQDKWKIFLNEYLEELDTYIHQYLIDISRLKDNYFKYVKYYFAYTHNRSMKVDNELKLNITQVNLEAIKNKNFSKMNQIKIISLDSYEKRKELQNILLAQKEVFENYKIQFQNYLMANFTLQDLLKTPNKIKNSIKFLK